MILNNRKRDLLYRLILIIIPFIIIAIVLPQGKIYGSTTDWLSQHTVFPDYFRKIFYETGNLYPSFSLNLGGGQNFAQFTYYGLLRPDILLSYLLPQISMTKIIMISSILYLLLSIQLLYQWLKTQNLSEFAIMFASILYALAGPMIFHSHRHLMFISYMPGLILCLIGTDRYVKMKKAGCLVSGVFLMIITSYFFSVGGLVVVGIYGIYAWMKQYPDGKIKDFFIFILKYIGLLLLGIAISCFYLIPTAYAMILQTRPALDQISISDLLIPKNGMTALYYDEYSIGLSAVTGLALLYGFVKKDKASRLFCFFLLLIVCIPLVSYILNGMQYVRAKSLIPFIPLFVLLTANMIHDLRSKDKFPWWIAIFMIAQFFFFTSGKMKFHYAIDLGLCLFLILLYKKTKFKKTMLIYLLIPAYLCVQVNNTEDFPDVADLRKVENSEKTKLIQDTLAENPGLYRFDDYSTSYAANRVEDMRQFKTTQYSSNSNISYNTFYYDVMKQPMNNRNHVIMASVNNPYFSNFMGVRYVYAVGEKLPYGYHKVQNIGKKVIAENDNVLPVAYASSNLISDKQFDQLSWPYTMETLYMNTIVDKNIAKSDFDSSIQEIFPQFKLKSKDSGLKVSKLKNGMRISCSKSSEMILELTEPLSSDKLLLMQSNLTDIENAKKRETIIRINGITNKKTEENGIYASPKSDLEFVFGNKHGVKQLKMKFSKGTYTLKDIKFYISNANNLKERKNQVDALEYKNQSGSVLAGDIRVKENGYFVTSIPFQKGFTVTLDGKKIEYEEVNTAFVGFPITKGKHTINITYKTPGKLLGFLVSGAALVFACSLFLFNKKMRHR